MKLGIVSGTSIANSSVFKEWEQIEISTPFGLVEAFQGKAISVFNRHGFKSPLPPHAINYKAYVAAMAELGIDTVLSLSSVGSLHADMPPGTLVSCSDYVSFSPRTFIDDRMSGFMPRIDNSLIGPLEEAAALGISRDRVYAQTPGPRFETRAEVKILQSWGCDVVGMTFANEADLILEKGIRLNSFCMVDNFAHGVEDQPLTIETFKESVKGNQAIIDRVLLAAIEIFGNS